MVHDHSLRIIALCFLVVLALASAFEVYRRTQLMRPSRLGSWLVLLGNVGWIVAIVGWSLELIPSRRRLLPTQPV